MSGALLAVLLAFVANSILTVSQAAQKMGLTAYKTARLRGSLLWLSGTVGMGVSTLLILFAVSLGDVSLVGAMAGTGLATLALFSRFVMKEPSGAAELVGVAVILAGALLVGLFTRGTSGADPRLLPLFGLLGVAVAGYGLAWLLARRSRALGLIIGSFAGAFGGFVPVLQKASTSPLGQSLSPVQEASGPLSGILQTVLNPFTAAWVAASLAAVVVVQFSYTREEAIRVVPVFVGNTVLIPVMAGVLAFGDVLGAGQWIGVALILAGVLVIALRPSQ